MKKFKSDKRAYAIFRAGIAMDRMVTAPDPEEKNAAMRWAISWGISAKALPPKNLHPTNLEAERTCRGG